MHISTIMGWAFHIGLAIAATILIFQSWRADGYGRPVSSPSNPKE